MPGSSWRLQSTSLAAFPVAETVNKMILHHTKTSSNNADSACVKFKCSAREAELETNFFLDPSTTVSCIPSEATTVLRTFVSVRSVVDA